MTEPFALPRAMEPDLRIVRDYWETLIRGANDIPFWDDYKPSALPEISGRMALLDVFDQPFRLRFGQIVGVEIEQRYGENLHRQFIDEIEMRAPFEYLASQASALIETSKPTYYRRTDTAAPSRDDGYSRLLLPMWGNGRVEMLLCAFAWR